jgi:hypothetical protein
MGHSPQMTVMTYTRVIRVLEGEPRISAEKQIKQARRKARGPQGDPNTAGAPTAKCLHTASIAPAGFEPATSRL